MDSWKKGLIIHGKKYDYKELLAFCSDNIVSGNTNPWEKEIFRFIINWLSDTDHIIQFSSGTTGRPKEIRLAKLTMIRSAAITCNYFGLQQGNTALLCMPADYIAGKMMIVRALVCGLNLLVTEPKSVPDIQIAPSVDFCAMVPLQAINLLICLKDLSPVKKLILGGTEISRELEELVRPLTTEVYATYGMAETSSHVAIRRLNGPEPRQSYAALPGVHLSHDNRGCLVIDADYLPAKVITNDLVTFTDQGSFTWLGRFDNLINSGGIKIVPEEVEALIMAKLRMECIVLGLPDTKLGQKLVLVLEKDLYPGSTSTLKADLENILPRRWKPKDIIKISQFPRNDSLKIDRRKLSEMILPL